VRSRVVLGDESPDVDATRRNDRRHCDGIGEACALHLDRLGFQVFAGVRKDAHGEALRHKASPALQPVKD
jgi:hypothetical protein